MLVKDKNRHKQMQQGVNEMEIKRYISQGVFEGGMLDVTVTIGSGAAEAMEAIYQAMKTVNRRRKAHGDSQVLFLIQMSD